MHPPSPSWPGPKALCVLLLLSETRKTLIAAASSKAAKSRLEIREQDYSFNDGARDRPVIEVVTKDVKTSDIFNIMQGESLPTDCATLFSNGRYAVVFCQLPALTGEDSATEEGASWWKDAVSEDFTRQDLVLLALFTLCFVRFLIFLIQMGWRMIKVPLHWLDEEMSDSSDGSDMENSDTDSDGTSRQNMAVIQSCHLQFLLVVDKLKREMRDDLGDDTQQMVAALVMRRHADDRQVTLEEILDALSRIQAMDSSFVRGEEHLSSLKEDQTDADPAEAWTRLQDVYASFLRIQETIIRRQERRKAWRQHLEHLDQQHQALRRRQHRLEEPADEVLHQLHELTMELPQGFTASMFTSLGNAMHETMVTAPVDTRAASTHTKTASSPSHMPTRGMTRAA